MVEQQNGSAYTQMLYSQIGKTAIMNGQTLSKAFVTLPGGGTAIYNTSGLAQYRHADWLGSSRLTTTPARTVSSDSAYAPFGEEYAKSGTDDPSFTGQNADTNSTLYDFAFREFSPSQGRWVSPDPLGLGAANPANPQSWNRYAYVLNNPLSMVDPLGLQCVWDDGSWDSGNDPETGSSDSCTGAGGVWVEPDYFATLGLGDWSSTGNSDLQSLYDTVDWAETWDAQVTGAANNGSWAWNFTKSFFTGFSVFGPKSDPRPSCFGQFLADAGSGFVNSFAPPSPSPGEIIGVGTAMADYSNEVGIVAEQHLAQYGSRISKYTIGEQAGARAGLAGLLANADYQGAVALVNEYGSASSGQCK